MFEVKTPDTYKKSFCVGGIAKYSDLKTEEKTGRQYIEFTVAVNQNKEKPDFFDYIAYNSKARKIERYIREGMKVVVFSNDVTGSYKDKNGTKHKTHTSICIDIFPVDKNSKNEIIVSLESIFNAIEADRIFSSMVMNK